MNGSVIKRFGDGGLLSSLRLQPTFLLELPSSSFSWVTLLPLVNSKLDAGTHGCHASVLKVVRRDRIRRDWAHCFIFDSSLCFVEEVIVELLDGWSHQAALLYDFGPHMVLGFQKQSFILIT